MTKFVITKRLFYKGENRGVTYRTPHFSSSKIDDLMKDDAFTDINVAYQYLTNNVMHYDDLTLNDDFMIDYDVIAI